MSPEGLALCAAFCFASAAVTAKLGTGTRNMGLGLLLSLGSSTLLLGVTMAVMADEWSVPIAALSLFALSGLAGPGVGRGLLMQGVRDVGTSVTVPVQSSANAVIASAAGALLFSEDVGGGRVLALAVIVTGILACVAGGSANRSPLQDMTIESRPWSLSLLALRLPVAAGAAFAASDILRKAALEGDGDAVLGSFIGSATAFMAWLIAYSSSPQLRTPFRLSPSAGWFLLSGLFTAAAGILSMFALERGDLSVVVPILASQPVIVVGLGALLLRDQEQLRRGTVLGAALVVIGIAALYSM
jgi:drug/metabolite transporter (DMT)-like permease